MPNLICAGALMALAPAENMLGTQATSNQITLLFALVMLCNTKHFTPEIRNQVILKSFGKLHELHLLISMSGIKASIYHTYGLNSLMSSVNRYSPCVFKY